MKCILKLTLIFLIIPFTIFSQTSGTGFFISDNGYVATCYHVIEGATEIFVKGINNDFYRKYKARIVSTDRINDLAILKIDCTLESSINYSFKWDVSDVGQEVFTMGYPLITTMGEEIKLTSGIISSKSGFQGDITTYQITVAVQPGNSGGPLFDNNGFVIGVVNAKHTGAENAGYAIKSNILKNLIQSSTLSISTPQSNQLYSKSLTTQVKLAKKDVLIIEVNSSTPFVSENNKPNDDNLADIARVYTNAKRYGDAAVVYQKIIEASKKPTITDFFNLGNVQSAGKDWSNAKTTWEKVVEMNPKYASAYYQLGGATSKLDTTATKASSIPYYAKFVELMDVSETKFSDTNKRQMATALTYIAAFAGNSNDYDKAKELFERVLTYDKANKYAKEALERLSVTTIPTKPSVQNKPK